MNRKQRRYFEELLALTTHLLHTTVELETYSLYMQALTTSLRFTTATLAQQQRTQVTAQTPLEQTQPVASPAAPIRDAHLSDFDRLSRWFQMQEIELLEADLSLPDPKLLEIARKIATHYSTHLQPLFDTIKRAISRRTTKVEFFFVPSNFARAEQSWSIICQLCRDLTKELGFLQQYTKQKLRSITLRLTPTKEARHFFLGNWLEISLQGRILKVLEETGIAPRALLARNLKIRYLSPGGIPINHEIDLFLLVDNLPFCFEAKTGGWKDSLSKYTELCLRLNIPLQQAFLVLANCLVPNSTNAGITICSPEEFPGVFRRSLLRARGCL